MRGVPHSVDSVRNDERLSSCELSLPRLKEAKQVPHVKTKEGPASEGSLDVVFQNQDQGWRQP